MENELSGKKALALTLSGAMALGMVPAAALVSMDMPEVAWAADDSSATAVTVDNGETVVVKIDNNAVKITKGETTYTAATSITVNEGGTLRLDTTVLNGAAQAISKLGTITVNKGGNLTVGGENDATAYFSSTGNTGWLLTGDTSKAEITSASNSVTLTLTGDVTAKAANSSNVFGMDNNAVAMDIVCNGALSVPSGTTLTIAGDKKVTGNGSIDVTNGGKLVLSTAALAGQQSAAGVKALNFDQGGKLTVGDKDYIGGSDGFVWGSGSGAKISVDLSEANKVGVTTEGNVIMKPASGDKWAFNMVGDNVKQTVTAKRGKLTLGDNFTFAGKADFIIDNNAELVVPNIFSFLSPAAEASVLINKGGALKTTGGAIEGNIVAGKGAGIDFADDDEATNSTIKIESSSKGVTTTITGHAAVKEGKHWTNHLADVNNVPVYTNVTIDSGAVLDVIGETTESIGTYGLNVAGGTFTNNGTINVSTEMIIGSALANNFTAGTINLIAENAKIVDNRSSGSLSPVSKVDGKEVKKTTESDVTTYSLDGVKSIVTSTVDKANLVDADDTSTKPYDTYTVTDNKQATFHKVTATITGLKVHKATDSTESSTTTNGTSYMGFSAIPTVNGAKKYKRAIVAATGSETAISSDVLNASLGEASNLAPAANGTDDGFVVFHRNGIDLDGVSKWYVVEWLDNNNNSLGKEYFLVTYSVNHQSAAPAAGGKTVVNDETKTDADGTKTEIIKYSDGSEKVVETEKDGTVTTTETAADKSSVTKTEEADGSTSTVAKDKDGKVTSAEATVSQKAADAAEAADEPAEVPIAAGVAESAPVKISAPAGTELAIPVTKAADAPGTVVAKVDKDGKILEPVAKSIVEDGDAEFIADEATATYMVVDNTKQFPDVKATDWYADAVAFASAREIINGVEGAGETTFQPNMETSRAMVARILFNIEKGKAGLSENFGDVADNAWYHDAVAWANDKGIVTGYNATEFGPEDAVSREQFATMLYRYAKTLGLDTTATGDLSKFSDGAATHDYATEAMKWAVGNGFIRGYGNTGALAPTASATRAEIATMMQRFITWML